MWKLQGSAELEVVRGSIKNQQEYHKKFFGVFFSVKWRRAKTNKDQQQPAKTRKETRAGNTSDEFYSVAMQEHPLIFVGSDLYSF